MLKLQTVKIEKEDNLLEVLLNFFNNDLDFTGENGEEFLWNEANNYKNNKEYMKSKYLNFDGKDEELINKVFNEYFEHNTNYYKDYSYDVVYNKDEKARYISLAYIVE